ncbi:efflux RND transporter periplasmic adaptor subunit [Saccharophagus degradans]|uniref:Efflux RND transporter periplasmic adaptor subunit n=1 Tax=Saccharophagus degradans TaxID=86304 RepID=A0AAW7X589_9GAMM|nr:efflux RND transporter periplasmic adaptor subunit [Saccharophagus degradans]MBU2984411.1 efflux RND transporter periplasmic adaptor subunit [Saccharophagus degradans]MDO6422823.1 efflux RND transporter periplasmic adaptor subunit [Saccharophagus degradans]MDO6609244.1 efflux RND transporter periplasmic adaptor subunit [Saccharophagus degradans]WGO97445.1 efflux RND transporter periplasmic adaptor subunit [Saccharophagus degradans]
MKNFLLTLLGLVIVVGLIAGIKASQIFAMFGAMETMTMPPSVVASSPVEQQEWEQTLSSVGDLEAVQGVVVGADLPGRVVKLEFTPGAYVEEGAPLIQQDISSEKAQLRAAEAAVALAKSNLDRSSELLRKQVVSKSDFDAADANYKSAVAQADNIRTTIQKKTITAPFAGRLGIRMVNLGQDLAAGTPIVTLQTMDPIFVNFYLPQQELPKITLGAEVRLTTDAVPGKNFTGAITAINPEIDPATRSVRVQATLKNDSNELLPGMFTKVKVIMPEKRKVLAVPQTAIAYATYGDSVFVVTKENDALVAKQQFVRLGTTLGDYVEVTAGVTAEDEVVSSGVFKLQNGAPISINNEVQPKYEQAPTPDNS